MIYKAGISRSHFLMATLRAYANALLLPFYNVRVLLMYPNRKTQIFYDCVKMKCHIILIFTGLNVGPLAATTFQISKIYFYPKYAQC